MHEIIEHISHKYCLDDLDKLGLISYLSPRFLLELQEFREKPQDNAGGFELINLLMITNRYFFIRVYHDLEKNATSLKADNEINEEEFDRLVEFWRCTE
jgi:hypothetical protein